MSLALLLGTVTITLFPVPSVTAETGSSNKLLIRPSSRTPVRTVSAALVTALAVMPVKVTIVPDKTTVVPGGIIASSVPPSITPVGTVDTKPPLDVSGPKSEKNLAASVSEANVNAPDVVVVTPANACGGFASDQAIV